MIKHIFMGKARPEVTEAQLDELVEAWTGLKDKISEIRSVTAGRNVSTRGREWSVALVAEFDDIGAWERYIDHPEHKAVGERLSSKLIQPDGRAAVQYEF